MAISAWYSPKKCLSLNATYNFIVGPRGNGKTFAFKVKSIKDALYKGREFVYLRRWKPEIKEAAPAFFTDIVKKNKFPDWDFRVNGKYAQASRKVKNEQDEKKRKWKTIGYFAALSVSGSMRSISFANVHNLMFDEFIAPDFKFPKYLPSEFKAFLEFYNTVDRYEGRTRVFFISNSVTIMNPYFIALDLQPEKMGKLNALHKNKDTGVPFVAVEYIESIDFTAQVNQTAFGQWIAEIDPEYAAYAVDNEFSDSHEKLIAKKTSQSEYLFTIETVKHGKFSVWHDYRERDFFIQAALPKVEKIYTLDPNRMDVGKVFVKFSDPRLARIRRAYDTARIFFDKPSTRNAFAEIMDKK